MKILRVDPGLYPQEAEINGSLESMQQLVGGLIQVILCSKVYFSGSQDREKQRSLLRCAEPFPIWVA